MDNVQREWLKEQGTTMIANTVRKSRQYPTLEEAKKVNKERMQPGENATCTFCPQQFQTAPGYTGHME